MKIRGDYVTNSSSSSFIIGFKKGGEVECLRELKKEMERAWAEIGEYNIDEEVRYQKDDIISDVLDYTEKKLKMYNGKLPEDEYEDVLFGVFSERIDDVLSNIKLKVLFNVIKINGIKRSVIDDNLFFAKFYLMGKARADFRMGVDEEWNNEEIRRCLEELDGDVIRTIFKEEEEEEVVRERVIGTVNKDGGGKNSSDNKNSKEEILNEVYNKVKQDVLETMTRLEKENKKLVYLMYSDENGFPDSFIEHIFMTRIRNTIMYFNNH